MVVLHVFSILVEHKRESSGHVSDKDAPEDGGGTGKKKGRKSKMRVKKSPMGEYQ